MSKKVLSVALMFIFCASSCSSLKARADVGGIGDNSGGGGSNGGGSNGGGSNGTKGK